MRNHGSSEKRTLRLASALALLGAFGASACGTAEDAMSNRSVFLHPNGDVLAASSDVQLSDSVPGDAMTAGGSVAFDGITGGSYVGAGGSQDVGGRIEGSARVAGGNVQLSASVGRNVTLAGGNVELDRVAQVARNAYLAGGTVRVAGTVDGDVYVGARDVFLDGAIGGDVRVEAERLTIGPAARLAGDLRYRTADGTADIDPAAQITGTTEVLTPREEPGPAGAIFRRMLRLLAFLLTGTVLVALLPGSTRALRDRLSGRPGAALGTGLLGLILVPVGAVVVAVTILGLPLAAIAGTLFVIGLYVAPIIPSAWTGTALLGRQAEHTPAGRGEEVKAFLLGGLILGVGMLLPWVGWLVRLAAVSLGLGAVALRLFAEEPTP